MAEQATNTTSGAGAVTGTGTTHMEHNPGRPISWTGTSITIIGFIVGGVAFVPSPNWVVFWVGVAVAIIGLFVLLFAKSMQEDWY